MPGSILLLTGLSLSYFGYLWGEASPNPSELVGSLFFWLGFAYLLFVFPLREVARSLGTSLRRSHGAWLFACYLAVHLVLYGFVLEGILAVAYGTEVLAVSSGFIITTDVFSPPSLSSALFDLVYNPSIVATVQPIFSVALSFYSIFMATVIAVLVVTNVARTRELGELCTMWGRTRSFVLLPALGVALGASCCLSVAGLLAIAAPSLSVLESNIWAYYATYFAFPTLAVFLLWFNLRAIRRISAKLASPSPA